MAMIRRCDFPGTWPSSLVCGGRRCPSALGRVRTPGPMSRNRKSMRGADRLLAVPLSRRFWDGPAVLGGVPDWR